MKRNKNYPKRLDWPPINRYAHLDGLLVFSCYEKYLPSRGIWPLRDDCLSYVWKQSKINQRNGPGWTDIRKDGQLYLLAMYEKFTKEPHIYPLVGQMRHHFKQNPNINWKTYRIDLDRSFRSRAARFESTWISEVLPYLGSPGGVEKTRGVAFAYLLMLMSSKRTTQLMYKRLFAQPIPKRPDEAYINLRMRNIALKAIENLSAKTKREQNERAKVDQEIHEKVLVGLQVKFALEPLREDLEKYYPELVRQIPT